MDTIYAEELGDQECVNYTGRLFGLHFPLVLEPAICVFARRLSQDYTGGMWRSYALCNGGFYMAPTSPEEFTVRSENGYAGRMSADAFGITTCLYAYSHLSFAEGAFAETCAEHYHRLRPYALDHREARGILAAID